MEQSDQPKYKRVLAALDQLCNPSTADCGPPPFTKGRLLQSRISHIKRLVAVGVEEILVVMLCTCEQELPLAPARQRHKRSGLPTVVCQRPRRKGRAEAVTTHIQRIPEIGMRVQELAVIDQQIQLVLRRTAADDIVKYMKAFLRVQRSPELCGRFIDAVKEIEQYSLAIRFALLQKNIFVQSVVFKNGAVVDKRPAPATAVRPYKGMAILVFHVAYRRQTDMRQRGFGNDGFRQELSELFALIRALRFTSDPRFPLSEQCQSPAVGMLVRVRIEFPQIGIQFLFPAARDAVYFTHDNSPFYSVEIATG